MRTSRIALATAWTLAVLAGCVSVQSTRLGSGLIRPSVSPDKVAIYRNAEQVRAQYEEVALLSAAGDYSLTNEEQMYKKMREKAGALGANGIILDSLSEPTTGAKVANFLIGTTAERKGKAVAVFIKETAS